MILNIINHIKYLLTFFIIFVVLFEYINSAERSLETNVSSAMVVSVWIWFLVKNELSHTETPSKFKRAT